MICGEPLRKRFIPMMHSAETHTVRMQDGKAVKFRADFMGLNIVISSIVKTRIVAIVSILFCMGFPLWFGLCLFLCRQVLWDLSAQNLSVTLT